MLRIQLPGLPRRYAPRNDKTTRIPMLKSGFTLLEVMIVLVILTIIASFAVPSWRAQLNASEDRALIFELQSAIEFAQHEALINRVSIGICPTKDGLHCEEDWGKELMIFNAKHENTVIKHIRLSSMHGKLFWRSYPHYRSFLLMSLTKNDNGTIWHCHDDAVQWAIKLNQMGMMEVVYGGDGVSC